MIITIASQHGAGKSTTIDLLLKALPGMRKLNISRKFRELAAERGMNTDDFVQFLTDNPNEAKIVDVALDNYQKKEIEKGNVIVDSNLGAMFAPKALNVLIICDLKTRAQRVISGTKRYGDKEAENVEAMANQLKQRDENDRQRYIQLYNFDMFDEKNYDLIIDNSKMTKDEVVHKILEEVKRRSK